MRSGIDPIILQKLQAFASRRRALILLRGTLATVATLTAAMIVVAALDYWIPLLPDSLRWVLSGSAYAVVFAVAWWKCVNPLMHAPDQRQIARIVEHAEPKLREDLLSAVELGRTRGEVFDSEQFRGLVQTDVSARVKGLKMESLLPVGLLKRYLQVAAILGAALMVLMLASGFRFGNLFLRALLPGANLDRVSATQIVILEPVPGDQTVPQGDAVRLMIELKGQLATTARLESESPGHGREVVEMTPLGDHRFATTIQVARESVRYRVQAGDALTRRYELTAVARPHELAFEKIYEYPAYSRIPAQTVKEDSGGLAGLEGSEVQIKFTTNQKVKSGELRVDRGGITSVSPLESLPDGRLGARVPLSGSGTYRVHLIAAGTGFENKFSPEYEVRAEPDLLPTLVLEEPKQDLISKSDDLVRLSAAAADDIGLASIVQMVKVNEGAWKEVVLNADMKREARIEREWDLSEEGVKAGDLLTTKLIATDFKGGQAESRTLQVTVVAAGFEIQRLSGLATRQALYRAVKALATSGAALEEAARAARFKYDQSEDSDPERKQVLGAFVTAYGDYDAKLTAAWMALNTPLREVPANHEGADLVLLGRLLNRIHNGEAGQAVALTSMLDANPSMPAARELMREVHEIAGRVKSLASLARDAYDLTLAAEEIDVAAELCIVITAEQERIVAMAAAAGKPQDWSKVTTRLRTVLSVCQNVESILESLKSHGGPIAVMAGQMHIKFSREIGKMERDLAEGAH